MRSLSGRFFVVVLLTVAACSHTPRSAAVLAKVLGSPSNLVVYGEVQNGASADTVLSMRRNAVATMRKFCRLLPHDSTCTSKIMSNDAPWRHLELLVDVPDWPLDHLERAAVREAMRQRGCAEPCDVLVFRDSARLTIDKMKHRTDRDDTDRVFVSAPQ